MISKESIIDTYKKLVIKNKTSKITVKEICETMHISRTTFYKYFKDPYHIMETIVVNDSLTTMKTLLDAGLDPMTITEGWYIEFYKNKDLYYYAIKDETQNSLFNTLINKVTEFNMQIYKDVYPSEYVDYYAYKYAASQAMLLKKWILDGMKLPPKVMAQIFLNDINNGH